MDATIPNHGHRKTMHQVVDLLTPLRAGGGGRLTRLDVRVQLAMALTAILAVAASTRAWLPALVVFGSLIALAVLRVPPGSVLGRLAAPLGLAAVICILRAFTTGRTPWLSFHLGGWRLVATREGLADGLLIGLRVLASMGVLLVLGAAAPVHKICAALRWARLPHALVEVAMLMYRYIFLLLDDTAAVLSAQKVRLGYVSLRRSVASLGSLAGLVMLRSLDQVDRTHEAMLARGYQGRLPLASLPALRGRDWLLIAGTAAAISLVYLAGERWLP
jgi:cobalt/nickel transport system permease protein